MVFQNYALYPHMSVYENLAFGLKLRKYDKAEIEKRVQHAAEILGDRVRILTENRRRFQAGSANASRSAGRSSGSRRCFSSTSR